MKRGILFMAVLLAALMVFSGCQRSQAGVSSGQGGGSSSGARGIEYWCDKPNPEAEAPLAAALSRAANIPVTIISYTDVASYQTAIQQSARTSNAPGLFTWWSGFQLQALVENGLLADLTDVWQTHIIPNGVSADLADALRFNGRIYAAPWASLNNTLVYNKKIFERLGLREPTTFEEFLDVCARIKAAGIYPIGHHNASWGSFVWLQIMLGSYDPQLYMDICSGKEKYTGDKMRAAMRVWDDMFNKGYFSDPRGDSHRALADEEVAMLNFTTGDPINLTRDYGLQPMIDYDTFVMPSQNPANRATIFFEVAPLCVSANSSQREEAIEVIKHYYETPVQQVFSDNFGYVNSSSVNVTNAVTAKMYAFGSQPDKYQLILRFYENTPSELRDVVINEMARFWARQGTIDQVLAACQAKADQTF
jgi:multiple sugar transport system substrate-binding protein